MPQYTKRCWLTFVGECQDKPCIWKMATKFPDVAFDIRQSSVGSDVGVMALQFTGDEDKVNQALQFLESLGVKIDPVEGGSNVAG